MVMEYDIAHSILAINADAKFVVTDEDLDKIEWKESTTPISKSDIQTKQAELKTAYDAKAYARKRAKGYPTLSEFAEAYCEKEIGGNSTKWDSYKTAYNKVRSDNPKS